MVTIASKAPAYAAALLTLAPMLAHAQSQEMARVISSTPVVTQVASPQQVCTQSQVLTTAPKSGVGSLLGAVAGGVIGSQIGGGSGRALATVAGVIGGAVAGDAMEATPPTVAQPVTSCTQQLSYENRVTAYNVVYEYAGKQYAIQLPNDPGPMLPIRISPSVAVTSEVVVKPTIAAPAVVNPPVVVMSHYPGAFPQVYSTPPVYSAPPVYLPPPAYYGPPAVSLRWGFGGGWGGHRHHHYRY